MQEHEWSWHLSTFLRQEATIQHRVCIETPFATFDIDYFIEIGGRKLGLMFGKLDEMSQRAYSAFRDALLIDAGVVDILYRFDVTAFNEHLQDCLALIARWNPELFCERGLINIERLASNAVLAFRPAYNQSLFSLPALLDPIPSLQYGSSGLDAGNAPASAEILFRRMCRFHPEAWLPDYQRAMLFYGISQELLNRRWSVTSSE